MKVLVTGGAGFIGANLCRELVRREHDVVVLDDLSTGHRSNLDGLDVDLRVGTVLDGDEVTAASSGAESIVHLAAIPATVKSLESPLCTHAVNVTGTLTVLEAARATGAHMIVASSSAVYGRGRVMPKSESMAAAPVSPYAASKLATEAYALAYRASFGLDCLAFRLFNVFGPLQRADHPYAAVIPSFVRAALRDEPLTIYGDGDQSRDFTFVDTVVEVLADSVARRVTSDSPINLALGVHTTINDVAALLANVLGRSLDVVHAPSRPGDVRHSQASDIALQSLFPGLMPVPLRIGLNRTVAWMAAEIEGYEARSVVPA